MLKNKKKFLVEIPSQPDEAREAAVEEIKKRLDLHQNIIYAVLVVVAVGFIAIVIATFDIFIQHFNYQAEKYSEYTKKLDFQTDILQDEKNKKIQSEMDQAKEEIENLWKNKYPLRK